MATRSAGMRRTSTLSCAAGARCSSDPHLAAAWHHRARQGRDPCAGEDMAQSLFQALDIETPIVQAPMGGGPSTPELVAAVSNAGGLGSLGAAYLTPVQIDEAIRATRALTDRPFAVNLFAGGYEDANRHVDPRPILDLVARLHEQLGIDPPAEPVLAPDPFSAQLEAILDARPAVFSFTFGLPSADDLQRVR